MTADEKAEISQAIELLVDEFRLRTQPPWTVTGMTIDWVSVRGFQPMVGGPEVYIIKPKVTVRFNK